MTLFFVLFFMPPTLKKWGTYWFRLVRVSVCVCVCVFMGHRDIVLKLHVWIFHGKIADAFFWFCLNYLPLLNYGSLTNKEMKFCKCRISKSIIARNLKLVSADRGWWIKYLMKNCKKSCDIFWVIAFFQKFWTLKFCNYYIPEWDIILKLHVWIPHGKIADAYFFLNYIPL